MPNAVLLYTAMGFYPSLCMSVLPNLTPVHFHLKFKQFFAAKRRHLSNVYRLLYLFHKQPKNPILKVAPTNLAAFSSRDLAH